MLRSRTSLFSHTQRILLGLMVVLLTGCPKLSTNKPIPPAQATQTKKQKKEKKKETERLEKERKEKEHNEERRLEKERKKTEHLKQEKAIKQEAERLNQEKEEARKAAEPLKEERGNYPEMKKEIKTILCKLLPVEIMIFRGARTKASDILRSGQGDQSTLKKLANVKIILQYLEEFQAMVTADNQNIAYLIEAKKNFEAIKNYTKAEKPGAADATLIKRIAPAAHDKIIAMLNCLIKVEAGGDIEQFKKALQHAREADKAYDESFKKKK